jgi:hypothetical protein
MNDEGGSMQAEVILVSVKILFKYVPCRIKKDKKTIV